jgi:phosphate:Na+ symporter
MLGKIFLPTIFIILSWGFWVSPDFKMIAAGVAIFLFGMLSLDSGLKVFTGGTLEKLLASTTDKRWKSLTFGIVSTTIMQSSSLVSVITISFLSAGLIGLYQGVGIIFGANLGTTTGAWLIAGFGLKVDMSAYAMPILVFGTMLVLQKSKNLNGIGYILAGLGFLFLGIHYMKEGFDAFKGTVDLTQFAVTGLKGLLIYTLVGLLATVIMQSSHATLVLTITALSAGQITYDNALALAIGANVGTTITAIIGSLSSNEQGKQLAGAHLIFNVVTGLVAIVFITQLLQLDDLISSTIGIVKDNYTMKLAVFHTTFNLLGVFIMLPLMDRLIALLEKIIPTQTPPKSKAHYLLESTLNYADTATQAVRNETLHMWDNTIDLIAHGIHIPRDAMLNRNSNLEELVINFPVKKSFDVDRYYELKIKCLYGEIISYISQTSFGWELEQSGEIYWLRMANQDMVDAIKDIKHLQKNLGHYAFSHNSVIKEQYNNLRVQIAKLVQSLELIRMAASKDIPSLMIDQLRLETDTRDTQLNKSINEMIRKHLITADMAVSLMNDKAYVHNISRKLIEMGYTLFIQQNKELSAAEKTIQLDQNELKNIHDMHQSANEETHHAS